MEAPSGVEPLIAALQAAPFALGYGASVYGWWSQRDLNPCFRLEGRRPDRLDDGTPGHLYFFCISRERLRPRGPVKALDGQAAEWVASEPASRLPGQGVSGLRLLTRCPLRVPDQAVRIGRGTGVLPTRLISSCPGYTTSPLGPGSRCGSRPSMIFIVSVSMSLSAKINSWS